jgi:hypothetical protein
MGTADGAAATSTVDGPWLATYVSHRMLVDCLPGATLLIGGAPVGLDVGEESLWVLACGGEQPPAPEGFEGADEVTGQVGNSVLVSPDRL